MLGQINFLSVIYRYKIYILFQIIQRVAYIFFIGPHNLLVIIAAALIKGELNAMFPLLAASVAMSATYYQMKIIYTIVIQLIIHMEIKQIKQ